MRIPIRSLVSALSLAGLAVAALVATSCQTVPQKSYGEISAMPHSGPTARESAAPRGSAFPQANLAVVPEPEPERPGLGTGWGERRRSNVVGREFSRGNRAQPWATGKIFYNDEKGAKAMAGSAGFAWGRSGPAPAAAGTVSIGLKDSRGRFLKSFSANGERFFVGEEGERYTIWLKNQTPTMIEVVVSVDGLDVLDGQNASFSKRGHVIYGKDSLTIDGFRQSLDTVAAFRFSGVADSYAERRHGDSRNVGVIGVAVFGKDGRDPFDGQDVQVRTTANPFPRAFATPP